MIEQIDKNCVITSELLNTNLEDDNNLVKNENPNNIEIEDSVQHQREETSNLENDETNQANCLALTVQKNYNLTTIKNIFTKSARMSLKIVFSTFVLNFLRMFF